MTESYDFYWLINSDYRDTVGDYDPGIDSKCRPKSAFCKTCRHVLEGWYPRHVEAWLSKNYRAVLLEDRVPLVHTDIWRQLAPYCPNAVIGPVWIQEGDIDRFSLDWVAVLFPANEIVYIRGGPTSPLKPWICDVCGQQQYCNISGTRHLVRNRVPKGTAVFQDNCADLIIAEPIAQEIDWSGFPDMYYTRMPVLDRPLDGVRLLGDPDWTAMEE